MSVAIIDYGSGNLHSARKAFERAACEAGVSSEIKVTARPEDVLAADHLVLPGVGAFADCRRGLDGVAGMVEAMEEAARKRGRPFLGICVGAQLLATRGLEHEVVAGLNWIAGDVAPIKPRDPGLKIPHMGWNTLDVVRRHPLLDGVRTGPGGLHAYFVHSYQLYPDDAGDTESYPARQQQSGTCRGGIGTGGLRSRVRVNDEHAERALGGLRRRPRARTSRGRRDARDPQSKSRLTGRRRGRSGGGRRRNRNE